MRRLAVPAMLAALMSSAWSAERALGDAGCAPVAGEQGVVAAVAEGGTLVLADGLAVRLAGIDMPSGEAGRAALAALALGKRVELRYGGPHRDRYGRAMAQVWLAGAAGRPAPDAWLQAALVADGQARVAGFADDRACLATLLGFERVARAAGRSLWAQPVFAVRDAQDPSLRAIDGLYLLVEGRVVGIGRRARTVYVDFGREWSTDFTVSMDKATADLIDSGSDPLSGLEGRRVRVRGWLTQRSGPWIRVDHPEQIEVLDGGDGTVAGQ
jgi:endonuclease YncB( thermonuclease family)